MEDILLLKFRLCYGKSMVEAFGHASILNFVMESQWLRHASKLASQCFQIGSKWFNMSSFHQWPRIRNNMQCWFWIHVLRQYFLLICGCFDLDTNTFAHVINFINSQWGPCCHVIMGLSEVTNMFRIVMVEQAMDLLLSYNLLDQLIVDMKDEDVNLSTFA